MPSSVDIQRADTESADSEIWIVQTPDGFDLSKLQELPLSGETFTVDNKKYTTMIHTTEQQHGQFTVLLPSGSEKKHLKSTGKPARFIQILPAIEIPEINLSQVKVSKPVVPQREGLYMRTQPTGYSAEDYEESTPPRSLKRTHVDGERELDEKAEGEAETASKKSKKEKKEKSEKKDKKDKKEKKEKKEKRRKSELI